MAYPIRLASMQSMGSDVAPATQSQAEAALRSMRSSLKDWLKYRSTMDEYVAGKRQPAGLLRNPGAKPLPPAVAGLNLRRDRLAVEQDLAETLYALLVECGINGESLPQPNVSLDSDAAAKLAQIAINGRTSSEAATPTAQGFLPWLIVIPVAGVVVLLSQLIKSKADVAKEQAHNVCVMSGACTDSGFWLKIASVAVIGWLAWDKLGIREKFKRK